MKIYGTGIDIVEVDRVRRLLGKNNRFRDRVFTKAEIRYCEGKKKKYEHYAVRFAAKESVWKALGKGGIGLKSIEVKNETGGKPQIVIKHSLLDKKHEIVITLSHTKKYAIAHALVLGA
jgi:holo-[acyl-carrier protein] synthase